MSDPTLTFDIRSSSEGYAVTCSGFRVTGFPTHEQAAGWVLEYIMHMFGQIQRQNLTEKWLGGKQGVTE